MDLGEKKGMIRGSVEFGEETNKAVVNLDVV